MAISITWATKVINVPKADTQLIQSNPIEIRELDLNTFRLTLKNLEDSEEGIVFDTTHVHNPSLTIGGVQLARTVELINGYTVTFEDGQYAVNLFGANSNVGDVINVNQVSIRSGNSAGLVTSSAIEYGEFGGGVHIDAVNGEAGAIYPIGTPRRPVDNLTDAKIIAAARGFREIHIVGNLTLAVTDNIDSYVIRGESAHLTHLTFISGCCNEQTEFHTASLSGIMTGNSVVLDYCHIGDVVGLTGHMRRCLLEGTITLGGTAPVHFLDCWSGVPGLDHPDIDMGGSGRELGMRGYAGDIGIRNLTGNENISIDMLSAHVYLHSTVTAGTILIRGVGKATDESGGTASVDITNLVNPYTIADQVYEEDHTEHLTIDSYGYIFSKVVGTCQTGTLSTTVFTTDRTEPDGFWTNKLFVQFTGNITAALAGKTSILSAYINANGQFTVDDALPVAPANGDTFYIINE